MIVEQSMYEIKKYKRSPWGDQKWYVSLTDAEGGSSVCGHSHKSELLASRCLSKWMSEDETPNV